MKHYLRYGLLCLGLFLGLLCIFSTSTRTAEATLTPPVTGDWTVNGTENPTFGSGSVINVNGTVYINGSLTLDGAQLNMNCTGAGTCGIEVNASGSFKVMRNSFIHWGSAYYNYYIWAKPGSSLNVTNSSIWRVTRPSFVTGVLYGGINVDTSNFVFKGNNLNYSIGGLALNGSAPTEAIRDNMFYQDDIALALVNNSDVDLVNNVFLFDDTAIMASKSFLNISGGMIANGIDGVQGFNSTIKMVKVTVDANYYNIYMSKATATLVSCDISTSIGYDYGLFNGATIILNDTIFEGASMDMEKATSNLFSAYWGVDVKVQWDTDSTPINGSNVSIKDQKSTTYPQYMTNVTGRTQTFWVLAFVQSSNAGIITKDYYTPHNFSATYKGLSSWTMVSIYGRQTVTVPLYDTIPPLLNITNPTVGRLSINTTTLEINGTSSDGERTVSSVQVSIGGYDPNFYSAIGTLFWNYTLELPGDGIWLVTIKAVDNSGNARLATIEVTVDTTSPRVTVMGPSNGAMVSAPDIEVHGFTEIGAILTVNGNPVNVSNDTGAWSTMVQLSEGDNTITVTATDTLNNSLSFDILVILDTLEPEVAINLYKVDEVNNVDQENVTVTGDADPNDLVTINGNSAHRSGASFDASVHLVEGRNTVEVLVTDTVGNVNRTVLVFYLDTTPPTIFVTWPYSDYVTSQAYIIVTGRVVGATDVTINGRAADMDGEMFSLNVTLSNGGNTISIEAMDELGNTATVDIDISQDSRAPEISISQPGDNYVTDQETVTVKGTVKGTDVAWVRVNGKPYLLQGENFTYIMNLSEGINIFLIEASDIADNTASASRTITLDTGKGKDKESESKSFFELLMDPADPLGLMLWIMIIVIIAMCAAVGSVVAKAPKEAPPSERPQPGRPGGGPRPGGPGGPQRGGPYGRRPPPRGGPYGGPGPGPGYGRRGPPPPGYPRRRSPPYGRRGPPPDEGSGGYPPPQEPSVPSYTVPSTTESYQPGDLGPQATTQEAPVEPAAEEVPVFQPAVEEAPIVEPAPYLEASEATEATSEAMPEPEPASEPGAITEPATEAPKPEMEQNIEAILQTLGPGEGVTAATAVAASGPGKPKAIDMEKKVEARPVLKCPNCGGEVKANWPACPFCDYNLKGGEQKPSKPPEPKKEEPPVAAKAQAAPKKEDEKKPEPKKEEPKKKGDGGKEDLDNLLAKLKLS